MKLSKPQKSALRKIRYEIEVNDGRPLTSVYFATPSTLRSLERLKLITCHPLYAANDVALTDLGITTLDELGSGNG